MMRNAAPRWTALLVCAMLAGCASAHETLDTGVIAPEASATLVFAQVGEVPIHCHPHPFMEQKVTVVEGAPGEAHVHIFDGNGTDEFRFEPAVLEITAGTNVTYHNHGTQAHTATQKAHGGH